MGRLSRVTRFLRSVGLRYPVDLLAGSVCEVRTEREVFHLTFDDGPHPEVTPRVLDALDEFGAPATFFVLADRAKEHPDLLRHVLERGHGIGLHGRTHQRLSTAPWKVVRDEILRARREVEEIVGRRITLFRPPFGAHGVMSLAACNLARFRSILWSVDTDDWKGLSRERPLQGTTSRIGPGGISLAHDTPVGGSVREEASRGFVSKDDLTRALLEEVHARGLRPVALEDLLDGGEEIREVTVPGRHRVASEATD